MIILDLDNCIANDEHRINLIDFSKTGDERYHDYHVNSVFDKHGNDGLLQTNESIVIFTARPERYRKITESWLSENRIPFIYLFMRKDGELGHAPRVKERQLKELCSYLRLTEVPIDNINSFITHAYDDRQDVIDMYIRNGIPATRVWIHEKTTANYGDSRKDTPPMQPPIPSHKKTAADILIEMAETYRERNTVYGNNYRMVAKLIAVLFPNGVPPELVVQDQWHLWELILVKLSRYAVSNLTHTDSIHDAGVYAAMCEAINLEKKNDT